MPDDQWTTIPADAHFPGMTRLERDGRTVVCVGVGKDVREAILAKMEGVLPTPPDRDIVPTHGQEHPPESSPDGDGARHSAA